MNFYIPKHTKTEGKKGILKKMSLPIATSVLFMATVVYWNSKNYGLALECNGQEIAKVQSQEVYEEATNLIRKQVQPGQKSKINKVKPQIKIMPVGSEECCERPEEIKERILENSDETLSPAFAVYVNEKISGIAKTKEEIEKAIDEIINENKNGHESSEAQIQEKIEIKEGLFEISKIESSEKVKENLCSQTEKVELYTVSEGDSVVSIAEKFGISPEKLLSDNEKSSDDQIFQGDKLKVILPDSLIHIKVVASETEERSIPYETVSEEDKNLQKGKIQITQAGVEGKEQITYSVTYVNGKEVKKEQISAWVIAEPTTQNQIVGTKQQEEFIWPVPYTKNVTSPYGRRWGTFHYGIDISVHGVDGKEILAAKGGTVEKASLSSKGYGNHIIINHNDGTKTLYGHCKSLCVSQGQSVSQGDKIAYVGSTGNSTGPHLHFEVMVNGEKKDPKNYVS